jgi:Transglutaminase-like superfamily
MGLTMIGKYLLAEHVHVCFPSEQTVFLDLRRDKYLGVDEGQAEMLRAAVAGWPESENTPVNQPFSAPDLENYLRKLIDEGLLTTSLSNGKVAVPVKLPEVSEALLGNYIDAPHRIQLGQIRNFLISASSAALMLRWRSMESTVRHLKKRRGGQGARRDVFSIAAAREAVRAFDWLRPFAFSARNGCLMDSLALVEFLARENMFARWVIGVRVHPFEAHCWVQHEDVVLNDLPERVRKFTPVLAV